MQALPILILTSEIQSGKTSFLQLWVKQRSDTAGWLSPVINGERFFYNIPEQTLYNMEAGTNYEKEILKVGKYTFLSSVFLNVSQKLIKWSNEKKWNYIIIDEIGPLELEQQKGLFSALEQLVQKEKASFKLMLVIRKSLLNKAIEYCNLHRRKTKIIHLNEMNDEVAAENF